MNIKTKIFSLCTLAVMTITFAGNSFAAGKPFTDLENVFQKEKVLALQQKGYVNGVADGLFAPDNKVSAAEGIQFIVNGLKLNIDHIRFIKEPKATDYYPKADNDAWYAKALIIASLNGLDLPNNLNPSQKWSREEFTFYLIKATERNGNLPLIKLVPVKITDENEISIGNNGAIQRSLAYGVSKLNSEGKFNPKEKITRAEAAEQIYNVLEYIRVHPAADLK